MAIKPGIVPAEIKYTADCTRCTCRFEFTGADGKIAGDQRDGDFITVDCPTCSHPISTKVRTPVDEARRRQSASVDPY
jgi:hypothetical protein